MLVQGVRASPWRGGTKPWGKGAPRLVGCPGPRGWFSPEMPSSCPSTPVPHKLLPFLEDREGTAPGAGRRGSGSGAWGTFP